MPENYSCKLFWHSDVLYQTSKVFPCLSYTIHTEFSLGTLAELWDNGDSFLDGDKSVMQGLD